MVEFSYREEESKVFGKIYRPIADIYFKDKFGNELVSFMYIDSGADIILIPRQFGETLGLELKNDKIEEVGGIGNNKVPIVIKEAMIRIGEKELKAKIAWALIEEVPPLLGRIDVFDNFDVIFKQKNKKIIFEISDLNKD